MIADPLLTPLSIYTVAVPIVVALVQVFKGVAPASWWRFSPLVAVALGLVVGFGTAQAFPLLPEPWIVTGLKGLGVGLAASGLYSSSRSLGAPLPGPGGKA